MGALHFRIGADFGITLMQIANEHLLYSADLDKALNVYTESFGGELSEDMALKLLSGEMIVLVDEKEQMFNVVERKYYMQLDSIYPKQIDFNQFVIDKQEDLDNHVKNIEIGLDSVINKYRYKKSYRLDIPVESIMKYIYGKEEELINDMMDELEYDDELQQIKRLIKITKDFIEKSIALSNMIMRLEGMYNIQTKFDNQNLLNLVQKVQDIAKAEFYIFTEGDDNMLNAYMEASKEIDNVLSNGIEPVDIMSNYSAGWLSPEGLYYALNGEIVNMLHNQIADALMSEGIIPEETENPDSWLEQQGWVKIHDNNVQFAGCLNSKLGKPNVNMTEKQIEIVRDYITNCYASIIKAGWKLEKTSIGMFTAMAMRDPIALNKKYFNFD